MATREAISRLSKQALEKAGVKPEDLTAVAFTRTEFDLLWLLLTRRGEVFSRQQLLSEVWPSGVIVSERTVDVSITRIRKKIGEYATHLVARPGFGYCFD